MRSCGFEKVTVDRLLRQPPVHIDGKGLRAYRSLEQMAAKVSKEPNLTDAASCWNDRFRKESQKGPSPLVPKRIDIGTGFFAFVQSSGKWHFVKEH